MYLAQQLARLPFVPFELFDWITRVLPGDVITFGIDLMFDTMLLMGLNVAETAKRAEQATAVLLFLVGGTLFGALYFALMKARRSTPDILSGVIAGSLFGLPLIGIIIALEQPVGGSMLRILWLSALFLSWGAALSWSMRRLSYAEPEAPTEGVEPRSVERIGRGQFLITLGASSESLTAVSAGVSSILATNERQRLQLDNSMAHIAEGSAESSFPNSNDPVMPVPGRARNTPP